MIATSFFRFGWPHHMAGLLLFICYLAASDGLAADAVAPPLEGSLLEATVLEASVSLTAARRTRSNPRIAVGHYLDAAEAAVRFQGASSGNKVSEESRAIYNAAAQEVTVLLRSSAELWNRTEEIPAHDGIYRLHFAAGSRKNGTWDPNYFNFFRTARASP